jgi:hypothetical protein
MSNGRNTDVLLGRVIGTSSGWDMPGTFAMTLYEFEPAAGVSLPKGDLGIQFEYGQFEIYDDVGNVTFTADIVDTIKNIPRTTEPV